MMENILMRVGDLSNIDLKLKVPQIKPENFIKSINNDPGYLFIIDTKNNELNVSKIVEIRKRDKSYSNENKTNIVFFTLDDFQFEISIKSDLKNVSFEVLKLLYSRNNKEFVGNESLSIFSTTKIGTYSFARPVIDNLELFLSLIKERIFKEKLLYNNSIFSNSKEEKIYAEVLKEDDELFFSLTNDKMLYEDFMFLETRNEYYRPYFYEFYIDERYDSTKLQVQQLEEGELYEVEILEGHDEEHDEEHINGDLIFSASPIINEIASLKINKKISSKVKDLIRNNETKIKSSISTIDDEILIENSIMKFLPNWKSLKYEFDVTVYNVGQANWSNIKITDENHNKIDIVFDIGTGNTKTPDVVKNIAVDATLKLEENHMFILSHWDLDHIRGIVYLENKHFDTTWIVPQLPKRVSFAALRLAAYLKTKESIQEVFVSEKLNNRLIFKNDLLMLGKGEGLNSNVDTSRNGYWCKTSYNSNNNLGLLLSIENKKGDRILFSGDCEYIQFPNEFLKSYSAIVVSHHGAKIKVNDLKKIGLLPCSGQGAKAIVCVGKKDCYPFSAHKDSIEKLGYEVIETRKHTDPRSQIMLKIAP